MHRRKTSTRSIDLRRVARSSILAVFIAMLASLSANAQGGGRARVRPAPARATSQTAMSTRAILEAEQYLSSLGYWTGPVDGKFDTATRHALIAFQKVEGRATTGRLTAGELEALRQASPPAPRETGYQHVEVDLGRQVLFVVGTDGHVSNILPVSTGSGEEFTSEGWTRRAVTPTGRFKIQRKVEGWRKAPLGNIYYPNYFLAGVAIHGSASVPATPESHGCVRIPLFAAKEFSEMIPTGTVVLVHEGDAFAQGKNGPAAQAKGGVSQQR